MIKLPKELNRILQTLTNEGFEVYAVGSCVLLGLLGKECLNWELAGNAPVERIEQLMPEFEIVDSDYGFCEFDDQTQLLEYYRVEQVETHLEKAAFTPLALADNPAKTLLDPYGGREDIAQKLFRAKPDGTARLKADPSQIFRGIVLASDLDFKLDGDTGKAVKEAVTVLDTADREILRDGLGDILTAEHAAKALRAASRLDVLEHTLGSECFPPQDRHSADSFQTLSENLDFARNEWECRYALLFLCFRSKTGIPAIQRLEFEKEVEERLIAAYQLTQDLYFTVQPLPFKRFLAEHGMECYEYMETIIKQQRKVYGHPDNRILSRIYMMEDFKNTKVPIFVEDLVITAADLEEVGITDPDEAAQMLSDLRDVVVLYPRRNTKAFLLKKAKDFLKHPVKRAARKVHWYK